MEIGQILGKIVEGKITFGLRFGVITARTNSNTRVSLTISGASTAITGIRYLASYTPTVNDVVVCLVNDNDVIVLGKLT